MNTSTTFTTGKSYTVHHFGDSELRPVIKVVRRTKSSVWIKVRGEVKRKGIKLDHQGNEYCLPYGNYPLAAMLCSDRPA